MERDPTLVALLLRRVAMAPEQAVYTFLTDRETAAGSLTHAGLDRAARRIAAALRAVAAPGDRALLLFPPGLDFISAFFGCLYAGVVAVPAYPPHPRRDSPRLRAIARDAEPRVVLTTSALAAAGVRRAPELAGAVWLATDALPDAEWDGRGPAADDLAFLQYTSGSTALPKGVMVTHANLMHNERMIQAAFAQDESSVVVGWLPLYHDMGLIGNVLQPLFCGGRCVLMAPVAFLQRPRLWLEAISRYRATTSGGPNFAYELCVRRVPAEEREGLDLSSWRVAYSGAEPVRAETLERFAAAFAGNGFRAESFYPCYGLAEATLFVSGGTAGSGYRAEAVDAAALERHEAVAASPEAPARRLVGCGHAWEGQRIAVVDPGSGAELPPGRIGEIWVSGPSVAGGYWKRPEQTEHDFGAVLAGEPAGPRFLRTGDLGFVEGARDGEIFVTGRLKDLVILRGRNHYPQDLELTAESAHPALRDAGSAAFALDLDGEERLVLVCEIERRPGAPVEEIAGAVRRAIAEEHEVQAERVVLVRTGTIPKTSSGKIQRHACRAAFLEGTLEVVGESALARGVGEPESAAEAGDHPQAAVLADLQGRVARLLGGGRPDPARPLTELGLDSLSAVELKAGLEAAYGVPVPLADLIEGTSLSMIAEGITGGWASPGADGVPPLVPLEEAARRGPLPLTVGQKALWFLERLAPESPAYVIAGAGTLPEGADPAALRAALQALVDRHCALRTTFGEGAEGVWQRAAGRSEVDFRCLDAGGWDDGELRRRVHAEAFRPFDLERGPLLRAALFSRGVPGAPGDVLVLAVHHLVADLWSLSVLARELGAAYDGARLPPLDLEYGDFAAWQERALAAGWAERHWDFWRERLADVPPLELPADRPRRAPGGAVASSLRLDTDFAAALRAFAGRRGGTLFMALLAGFQALLARRGGQEDFLVGAPTAGRSGLSGTSLTGLVGYFVNPVPLRADFRGDPGAAEHLERVRGAALGAFAHQDFPYPWLAERLPDAARAALPRAVLAFQKAPSPELAPLAGFALGEEGVRLRLGGLALDSLALAPPAAQFDATLFAAELDGGIALSLQMDAGLFDAPTAERMLGHFARLLRGMIEAPERPVSAIDLLGAAERRQVLAEPNRTAAEVPAEAVHRRVAARAAETPDALAVASGDESVTYRELERRAGLLTAHLQSMGVAPESLVGICAPRSPDLVAGALAVLKAGGAYLPLDPAYPRERLELLLDDAGVDVLLAGKGIEPPGGRGRVVSLAGVPGGAVSRADLPPPEEDDPRRLAYVIYTSGSTGRPKGVAVPHGGLSNLVAWHGRTYGLTGQDRAALLASPGFDAAVWEMWPVLAAGASLHVPDEETRSSPERLLAWLAAERITVAFLPTPLAEAVLALTPPPGLALRALLTGGDRLRSAPPPGLPFRLINHYGPTESSVVATVGGVEPGGPVPPLLGGPIANTRAYLLDRGLLPVPAGVPGELFLGGAGLARGYLGRPDLTAERFVPDPFAGEGEAGSRLYRTGDLLRWVDGSLDFLGRIDRQVKVRGARIEPGEIEAALLALPGVREALVVLRDDLPGGRGLAAYVAGDGIAAPELRRALRSRLPEAMVPAAFAVLPALPLTAHGKLDRAALPAPEAGEGEARQRPSLTALEEVMAGIWAEILGLPAEAIGPRDSFFDLGGHSLVATRVAARVREAFGAELPLRTLFERPTLAAVAGALAEVLETVSAPAPPLRPRASAAPPRLSFSQERLWLLHGLAPESPAYNIAASLRLSAEVTASGLERALGGIVRRHEALRTTFHVGAGGWPVQIIAPAGPFVLPQADLSTLSDPEGAFRRLVSAEARRPFDLAAGPLVRALLVRLAPGDRRLFLGLHHAVADGWSVEVLAGELAARLAGEEPPPLPVQYADFAVWQREWLAGPALDSQLAWWRERLRGVPSASELPSDRARPAVARQEGSVERAPLPGLAEALGALGRRRGATLFMGLLAAFQALQSRLTGQTDLVTGSPVANRTRVELEGLIGFFVNTLALRTDLGGDPGFGELLGRVRETALGAYSHQDAPFERLVEELAPERDAARHPLFQVLVLLQRTPGPGIEEIHTGTAKLDLTLGFDQGPDGLSVWAEHDAALFDGATVRRLLGHFEALLSAAVAEPDRPFHELPLLTAGEREQILGAWSRSAGPWAAPGTVHALFEEQAKRTPEADALVWGGARMSYAELERRSGALARRLRLLGVGPEVRVGLSAGRSAELVVGVLGVLRAGGALVPLDPAHPAERLALLLADSAIAAVLTQAPLAGRLPAGGPPVILLEEGTDGGAEKLPFHVPEVPADALAYVIYTSGSTGLPKGVGVSHASAVPMMRWSRDRFALAPGRRVLQSLSYAFDFGLWEILTAVVSGAALHIPLAGETGDPAAFGRRALAEGIDTVHATPSFFRAVVETGVRLPGLRVLHLGGEALTRGQIGRLAAAVGPGCTLYNGYGPTEATVNSLLFEIGRPGALSGGERVPIGRPSADNAVYVVDRRGEPVPEGIPGELWVGGPGVARGYLGRPDLTAEKFVPDGFGDEPGGRLYRTGDLVRWLPEGDVEFLGRVDHQVKIRGFRIEPGEIEAALRHHPQVREAVVAAREMPGGAALVAWVECGEEGPGAAELREHLRARLPESMMPSYFVRVSELPLTATGKVDRRALPEPDAETAGEKREAPRTPIEELLAGVFAEVLEREEVGRTDSFFHLGGHSLLATRVVSRVREALGVELPLRALFEAPAVAALAERIEPLRREPAPPLSRIERTGPPPLSFAQERLWFLDQLEPGSTAYNMPAAVLLTGALDVAALAASLSEIVRRHESLRTRFTAARQVLDLPAAVALPVIDLTSLSPERRETAARAEIAAAAGVPFDLSRGPLVRAVLVRLDGEEHALGLTLHHIVSDGWSLGVLVSELSALYPAFAAGRPSPLPELPVQYVDFAAWQREWLSGAVLERQLAYWRERLAGAPQVLELPADRPRPAVRSGRGGWLAASLPAGVTAALRRVARQGGGTLFMALLAGFQALLSRLTGQEDLLVGSPVANRTRVEIEGLIGFFVNTLVLRGELAGDPGFSHLLLRARETALGAYAHQDLPFERLVEELAPERDLSRPPLIQVLLVLQNAPLRPLDLPGLHLQPLDLEGSAPKLDLTLTFTESADGLSIQAEHDAALFDGATVRRLLGHFESLLSAAVAEPDRPFAELPLLTSAELAQLAAWDAEALHEHPRGGTLHGLFEEQAKRTPEAVALVTATEILTYAELDRRSARVAASLRSLGVGPEVPVGVCLERTPDLVVALLGVLRSGGFSVPMDPRYPAERLAFLIGDSGARRVLVDDASAARVPAGPDLLRLDALPDGPGLETGRAESGNLAYLIYTSGSTGRPKAVAIEHRSAVLLAHWARDLFGDDLRGLIAPTSVTFDLSVFELFAPLAAGGTVILVRDALAVADLSLPEGIEARLLNTVPSAAAELVRLKALPETVRTVCLAGEALPGSLVTGLYESGTVERVFNLYGPSEDTTYSTGAPVERGTARPGIGRPLPGTRAFVVDRSLSRLPVGVPGELCLAGEGLARGYLGRPDLTAERFVPDPWSGERGARMYRTGDLARRLPDGNLDFLGRIDHQVKIRGFRIEPGEVEAVLSGLPGVREAAVVVQDGPRLVACVVGSTAGLRASLAERLPDYMVPSAWVELEALPRTPNGKLDRRELARLVPEAGVEDGGFVPPRTPIEELLAGVFAEVLERAEVGRDDSFFHLGGHSLLATRVVSRVREALGVELPLRALFEAPTVAALAERIEPLRREPAPSLRRVERTGPLPLSFAQERLWFLDQLEPGSPAYNVPAAVRLTGTLDVPALAASLGEIARRHEALRTRFVAAAQVVDPPAAVALPVIDLAALPAEQRETAARAGLAAAAGEPFDLARGPLVRAVLLRLDREEHALGVTLHHIVSDGWSLGVLVSELSALYPAFVAGRPSPLPELPVQYADFAAWQREWLSGAVLERQLAWWRERLAGAPQFLELPADRPRPSVRSGRGGWLAASLPVSLTDGLRRAARQGGGTLFMALLAGFQALLSRLTGQEDLLVGSPVANRTRVEVEGLIGFFVNTLVLRGELGGDPGFSHLLLRARETALGAYAHQDLPFERLVEELAPERDLSRSPLIQVLLVLQNAPLRPLDLPGLHLQPLDLQGSAPKLDLTLTFMESADGLSIQAEHDAALFDGATVRRLLGGFESLLSAAVAEPDRPFAELPLLTSAEREQMLGAWSRSAGPWAAPGTVHGLFEEQAKRTPEADALVSDGVRMSYAELERRSGALARRLRRLGVGPEVRVGLSAERSPELVVGILGVLRAGGVLVPLDPAHPAERLALLREDSGVAVMLSQGSLDAGLEKLPFHTPEIPADALAYVIYTSGSTGLPKGVGVSHASAVPMMRWSRDRFGLAPGRRVLQSLSYAFDFGLWEILSTLVSGAALHIPPAEETGDPVAFGRRALDERIDTVHATPSFFRAVAETGVRLPDLRVLHLGGEALTRTQTERLAAAAGPECALYNGYGPTEVTVNSLIFPIGPGSRERVPIGRPSADNAVYVVDRRGEPVPVGVPGELWVGGPGVARGYLGRPDLTAEKFVPDGFGREPGGRLYRTGDLVRWLPEGDVEFLGRVDHQVKIRGFRIEPGEIEAALRSHRQVREAVVAAREMPGGTALVAWVECGEEGPGAAELREHLRARLPEAMMPSRFVRVAELPLTATGKVDRRALPEPAVEAVEEREAPRTPVEELLAGLWEEVLGVSGVGRDDSFFHLGGHSLLAARVVSQVREAFGIELPVRAIFESPTLAGLAGEVERALGGGGLAPALPPVERTGRSGDLPLSFAQERLWFLDQLEPGSAAYNIPGAAALTGDLRPEAFARALSAIVARHESLRTRFAARDGRPVQVVAPPAPLPLPVIDLRGLPEESGESEAERLAREEAGRPFDLAAGPLLRACLLRRGETEWTCLLTLHHIAADGWSLGVLLRELTALYGAAVEGRPSPLPELPVQYADYAAWQRRWLSGEILAGELAWWRGRLAGAPTVLELPTDRPRSAVAGPRGGRERIELPRELREGVERLGRRYGTTLYMSLLAAFGTLLSRWADQDEVLVGSPVAGRSRRELEGLIGFFVNSLVQRVDLRGEPGFGELLVRVREASLSSLAHQDLPFERLVEELAPERSLGRSSLFQVMLAVQAESPRLAAAGLELRGLPVDGGTAKFDLSLELAPEGEGIAGWIEYRADLFEAATARRLAGQLAILLTAAAAAPETPVASLPLLSAAEREQTLGDWSRSAGPWAAPGTVHALIEEQARRTPDREAVVAEDTVLTYRELDRGADRLAQLIKELLP